MKICLWSFPKFISTNHFYYQQKDILMSTQKDYNSISDSYLILIQTARELFAEHGFHNTTIRMISKQANVNVAAVNYYFRTKENLYFEVFQDAFKSLYGGKLSINGFHLFLLFFSPTILNTHLYDKLSPTSVVLHHSSAGIFTTNSLFPLSTH